MCCNIECGELSNFWPVPQCHWQKSRMLWVSLIRAIASNLSGKLSASLLATIGAIAFKIVPIRMAHSRFFKRRNSHQSLRNSSGGLAIRASYQMPKTVDRRRNRHRLKGNEVLIGRRAMAQGVGTRPNECRGAHRVCRPHVVIRSPRRR